MIKEILKLIKNVEGNIITIGVKNSKIMDKLLKNNKINLFDINKDDSIGFFKSKKRKLNNGKTINIKKLNKYFNKKSIDYIICDIEEIKDYLKFFVKNSIYLNDKKLIMYGNNEDVDLDNLIKRYKRYNVNIETITISDNFILIIDNSKSKNKRILEKIYYIKDTLYNLVEMISNILVS